MSTAAEVVATGRQGNGMDESAAAPLTTARPGEGRLEDLGGSLGVALEVGGGRTSRGYAISIQ